MPKQNQKKLAIQKQNQGSDFTGKNISNALKTEHQLINLRLKTLTKLLIKYSIRCHKQAPNQLQIFQNYLKNYYEYYQYDQFDSLFQLIPNITTNISYVGNQQLIYKSFNLFQGMLWPIRFHSKFINKILNYNVDQIKYILCYIFVIGMGKFIGTVGHKQQDGDGYVVPINIKCNKFNRFYNYCIFNDKNILMNVGVQKIPIIKLGTIKRFEYIHYLLFYDIVNNSIVDDRLKKNQIFQKFLLYLNQDVSKKDHGEQLKIQMKKYNCYYGYCRDQMFIQTINPFTNQIERIPSDIQLQKNKTHNYLPIIFKPWYVSTSDIQNLVFNSNLKRWVPKNYLLDKQQKTINQYQRLVNQQLIKRFVDFKSAQTLVQLLTKIPNFKVQLTQQQKQVIGQNGNVLVIGRSGTGKTTSAVLRLFAIQMLFKIRLSLSKKKYEKQLKDTQCSADDIDKTLGLHCIFLTASPILTNQIQRYYQKLTNCIKIQLEKKKQKVLQQQKLQQQQKKIQQQAKIQILKEEEIQQIYSQQQSIQQLKVSEKDATPYKKQQISIQVTDKQSTNKQPQKSKQILQQQEQLKKQFSDIKVNDKLQNEQFIQDQQIEKQKNSFEIKINKFKSLHDLTQSDYPGFFPVKAFIMMIDGTLQKPFFLRNQNGETFEQTQTSWHNQKKGVMAIENYYRVQQQQKHKKQQVQQQKQQQIDYSDEEELQHQYQRQIQLGELKQKSQKSQLFKNKQNKKNSFQVDYDYFFIYFWPTVKRKHYSNRNITAHLVWTEIYSTIKGGASSHLFGGFYLPQQQYIKQSTNIFLTKQQKKDIYQTFCQYQRWKINIYGYDLMDVVSYILDKMKCLQYNGPDIHYVMIDQVQDLPHSIIYLLSKIARYGVFYSGDTAQTIAKGIGFRFCDLKNLFDYRLFNQSLKLKKPIVKQLSINFRSHNNILQLANTVVSLIQILFPKTIDRLKQQISNLKGPKPMIVTQGNIQLLFYVLTGQYNITNQKLNQKNNIKKPTPLQFGCNQVVIVRDQQCKKKLPLILQHALCLTIYQAKGLQFNDVILYNFFQGSKCIDKWAIIKFLNVVVVEVDAQQYHNSITKRVKQEDDQNLEDSVDQIIGQQMKDNKVKIKKIKANSKIGMKDINDYAELCSELKLLYTAITRTKNTLIIYDEDETCRKIIQKLWQKLQVVELINRQQIDEKQIKNNQIQVKTYKKIINQTTNKQWQKQGNKMFKRGYYQQAMKCYKKCNNQYLFQKSKGNWIADNATKKLIQISSQLNFIKHHLKNIQKIKQTDVTKIKNKCKKQQYQTFNQFIQAAVIFQQLQLWKEAGQCYFSGKKYQKSFQNFNKANMYKQAGECLQMLGKLREAASYYDKGGIYLKTIQCLDNLNQWYQILTIVQKYSNKMIDIEKKQLLKKYSGFALQQLVNFIQCDNQQGYHKLKSNKIQIIRQEDSFNQQESCNQENQQLSKQNQQKQGQVNDKQKIVVGQMNTKNIINQVKDSHEKISEESVYIPLQTQKKQQINKQPTQQQQNQIIQQIKQPQENAKVDESYSFADLNSSHNSQEAVVLQQLKPVSKMQQIESFQHIQQTHQKSHKKSQSPNKFPQHSKSSFSFSQLNSSTSQIPDIKSQHSQQPFQQQIKLQPDIQSIKQLSNHQDQWLKSIISQIVIKTNNQYSIPNICQQIYNLDVRIIKTKGNIIVQDNIMNKIVDIVSITNVNVQQFFKSFKGYQSLITVSKIQNNKDVSYNQPQISQFDQIDPKFINTILDTLQSFKIHKLCLFVCNRYHLPHKAGRYLLSMSLKYSTNSQINNIIDSSIISPSINRKKFQQKGILASIALHGILENISADFLKVKVQSNIHQQSKNSLGSYFIQGLILLGLYKKAVFLVNYEQSLKIMLNFCDFHGFTAVLNTKTDELHNQQSIAQLTQYFTQYIIHKKLQIISSRIYQQIDQKTIHKFITNNNKYPLLGLLKNPGKIKEYISNNLCNWFGYLQNGPSAKLFEMISFITIALNDKQLRKQLYKIQLKQTIQLIKLIREIKRILIKKNHKKSYQIIQAILSCYRCRIIDHCQSMRFIRDGFAFVQRNSIICNYFIQIAKNQDRQVAFFFQQDYNYVLVRTTLLIKMVAKKFEHAYFVFIRGRVNAEISWVQKAKKGYLWTDFRQQQGDLLLRTILKYQFRSQQIKIQDKKQQHRIKAKIDKIRNKSSFLIQQLKNFNFYLFQNSDQQHLDDDNNDEQNYQYQQKNKTILYHSIVLPNIMSQFSLLEDLCLQTFNKTKKHIKQQQSQNNYNILYCAGLNDDLNQSITKKINKQKYNQIKQLQSLYHALQFRKFYRLENYAYNILAVLNFITVQQQQFFTYQILIHLLFQYKYIQNNQNVKLLIPLQFLKYLPNIKLITSCFKNIIQQPQQINKHFLKQKNSWQLIYYNKYTCQLQMQQLQQLIFQYLKICISIQSKIKSQLLVTIILNMQIDLNLYKIIKEIQQHNTGAFYQKKSLLDVLKSSDTIQSFIQQSKKILQKDKQHFVLQNYKIHFVQVINVGNVNKNIQQSQDDYEIKIKLMQKKRKAAHKIYIWWRRMKQTTLHWKKVRPVDQIPIVQENRIVKMTYGIKYLPVKQKFLIKSSNVRNVLLSFFLKNIITSSLDFHFILMNLLKIDDLRSQYLNSYKPKNKSFFQLSQSHIQYEQQIQNMQKTLAIWQNDEKWLKQKNIQIKKKKVFEVKWMSKTMQKIIKKRAGLKKQKKLQNKKLLLKKQGK